LCYKNNKLLDLKLKNKEWWEKVWAVCTGEFVVVKGGESEGKVRVRESARARSSLSALV